jgi:nucleotide-binding universal stress UspA family protein
MYRSALVALRPDAPNDQLLAYALELAQRYALQLAGTVILDRDLLEPSEAVPLGGMAFKAELNAARIERVRTQMATAIGEFEQACAAAGMSGEVVCSADSFCPELSQAAQSHDLLLLGHPEEITSAGPVKDAATLQTLLRQSPGSAIVVPQRPAPDAASVVVAYDGSMQASRALKSFIASGFCADSPIYVVAFDDDLDGAQQFANLAAELLTRHGYQAIATPGELSPGASAAPLIEAACDAHGAQLLVMGAYGKPTIREFFLGTVTKRLLANTRIPMFIDH